MYVNTHSLVLMYVYPMLQESKKKEAAKRKRERESAKKAKPAKKTPKAKVCCVPTPKSHFKFRF